MSQQDREACRRALLGRGVYNYDGGSGRGSGAPKAHANLDRSDWAAALCTRRHAEATLSPPVTAATVHPRVQCIRRQHMHVECVMCTLPRGAAGATAINASCTTVGLHTPFVGNLGSTSKNTSGDWGTLQTLSPEPVPEHIISPHLRARTRPSATGP